MPDAVFEVPRLAGIYDVLEPDRPDLDPYLAMVRQLGADSVLDIGCGTGTFACLLAAGGVTVTGVDPAAASLEVARRKPFSEGVRWVLGNAASAMPIQVDLVTMTGNVAQVFLSEDEWLSTLHCAHAGLRPGGRLVFEVRDPDREIWREWTKDQTFRRLALPVIGLVETWTEVIGVDIPLVTFRQHFAFASDGAELVSDSTLRFVDRSQMEQSLADAGLAVEDVRDAPDRPGLEHVFVASRPG